MISYIFIFFSAIYCAVMDVISHHYNNSIFREYNNPLYWNPQISWKNKYIDWDNGDKRRKKWLGLINIHPAFTDAWHLMKSSMVICFIFAIVCYKPVFGFLWDLFLLGTIWNITFSLCYKYLFIDKN